MCTDCSQQTIAGHSPGDIEAFATGEPPAPSCAIIFCEDMLTSAVHHVVRLSIHPGNIDASLVAPSLSPDQKVSVVPGSALLRIYDDGGIARCLLAGSPTLYHNVSFLLIRVIGRVYGRLQAIGALLERPAPEGWQFQPGTLAEWQLDRGSPSLRAWVSQFRIDERVETLISALHNNVPASIRAATPQQRAWLNELKTLRPELFRPAGGSFQERRNERRDWQHDGRHDQQPLAADPHAHHDQRTNNGLAGAIGQRWVQNQIEAEYWQKQALKTAKYEAAQAKMDRWRRRIEERLQR